MVYIVEEVESEKVAQMNKEVVEFMVVVVAKHKSKFLELNEKFEKVLEAYEEMGRQIYQLENKIENIENFGKGKTRRQSSQLIISAPPPPIQPFNTIPIMEIPSTS